MSKNIKSKEIFVCSSCGGEHLKWSGRCDYCGQWNSLQELKISTGNISGHKVEPATPLKLKQINTIFRPRLKTKIQELDLVLGTGLVPGSVILLGGQPGIGKSTLVWQAACNLDNKVIYVAAEESPEQLKLRAQRLKIDFSNISIFDNSDISSWLGQLEKEKPSLLVVDSIQTVYDSAIAGSAGSIMQVKETALKIISTAKKLSIATIFIGHVTKDGEVAGPKMLEHLVDGVFYLEGERGQNERFLRCLKNRFGPTEEIGVFRLTEKGLISATDFGRLSPQKILPAGVSRTAVIEGSRVYFLEVQALVQRTPFGIARRNSIGFDFNRLQMILAILAKHTKINLFNSDVFLNIGGGYRLDDPLGDLAVLGAISSSAFNKPIAGNILLLGEIDLSGQLHLNEQSKRIIKASQKIGYKILNITDLELNRLLKQIL